MNTIFTEDQLARIREQAAVYQCACPAQVCVAISNTRELFAYQQNCLIATRTDKEVHERIAAAAAQIHAELERCLQDVLRLEGWDMASLTMPTALQKRLLAQFEAD
jgi:hypothetical protein